MDKNKGILIIGTGLGSELLVGGLKKKQLFENVIGFLDDYKEQGSLFVDKPILGKISELSEALISHKVKDVIIAIPSLKESKLKEIVSSCENFDIKLKILPPTYDSLYSLKTGRPWVSDVRPINLEDLLRRPPVSINLSTIKNTISEKTILVSGGGGSIGRELCNQIINLKPKKIIIIDNCEFNLYKIGIELEKCKGDVCLELVLGDIKDLKFIEKIFKGQRIDLVFHAAAYKHVPLLEFNIIEAIKNNIFGTYNLSSMAEKYNINKFIFVSTDKAVNPSSVMGCTKKISEEVLQIFSKDTKFITVRFGNVLGSAGSVIPLFEEQIKQGGPITITHPEITRYFMTIPESAQLIIQAGAIGHGKDILILDMGKQHKILNVAEDLVRLHGLEPERDIKFVYTGLRLGEKLFEELWDKEESLKKTKNKRIFTCNSKRTNIKLLKENLNKLRVLVEEEDCTKIKQLLQKMVPSAKLFNKEEKGFDELRKSKILITGARGFIGTQLRKRLNNESIPYEVTPPSEDLDLSDSKSLDELGEYSIVIHLASSLPQKDIKDFEKDYQMTKNLIRYCKKNNAKLIFTSSSAVYGSQNEKSLSENLDISPINNYGCSKAKCERLIQSSGIKNVILRIFNIYGFGQKGPFLIPSLFDGLVKGEVTIKKDVKRDFVHVEDVTKAILQSMLLKKNDIINIGSGVEHQLDDVLDILLSEIDCEIKVKYLNDINSPSIQTSLADISKARKLLNWNPMISLEKGIKDLVAQKNLNIFNNKR